MFKKIMIALAAVTLSTHAMAGKPLRVLYMEVDQGRELMSRNSPAYQNIYDQTGSFLQQHNIRLMEEQMRNRTDKRSFKEAVHTAKQVKRKKLDAVVTISLRHKKKQQGNKVKDQMVAIATIVDAKSLQVLDTVRVQSPIAKIKKGSCFKNCRQLIMRKHVRRVLPQFKNKVADRLHSLQDQFTKRGFKTVAQTDRKYTLTLKGFSPREVRHLEDKIARLDNTRDFSSLRSRDDKPAFWLERQKGAGNVRDDLSTVLSQLDLQARIVQTPKQITLIKVSRDLAYLD